MKIMNEIKIGILLYILFTLITGIVYPSIVTAIGQVLFPKQSQGSLIIKNGTVIGSELIAQNFTGPQYFHPRPSACDYNVCNSSGSNLGPTNKKLIDEVKDRLNKVRTENSLPKNMPIPSDIVTTSGSGFEPYISVDSALLQAPRVAKARGISEVEVVKLIYRFAEKPLGADREVVNIMKLNLALDELYGKKQK